MTKDDARKAMDKAQSAYGDACSRYGIDCCECRRKQIDSAIVEMDKARDDLERACVAEAVVPALAMLESYASTRGLNGLEYEVKAELLKARDGK
jgi:hypothetical protein